MLKGPLSGNICRRRARFAFLAAMLTSAGMLAGHCGGPVSEEMREQMAVIDVLSPFLDCKSTWPSGIVIVFFVEPLYDGHAVVVAKRASSMQTPEEEMLGYWVKEKEVFAVNQAAQECAPKASAPPEGITFELVRQTAIRQHHLDPESNPDQ